MPAVIMNFLRCYINWFLLLQNAVLTPKLIDTAKNGTDLSPSLIEEMSPYVDFQAMESNPRTPESFLQSHSHRFNFRNVLLGGKILSFEFIRTNPLALNRCWDLISAKIPLSESEMTEMAPLLDWKLASKFQKMTPSFIARHKFDVDWFNVIKYQNVSQEFVRKNKPPAAGGEILNLLPGSVSFG